MDWRRRTNPKCWKSEHDDMEHDNLFQIIENGKCKSFNSLNIQNYPQNIILVILGVVMPAHTIIDHPQYWFCWKVLTTIKDISEPFGAMYILCMQYSEIREPILPPNCRMQE